MDPTERFGALVAGPGDDVPLDELGFLIAAHAHPGLDVPSQLQRLDELAAQVGEPSVAGVVRLLFDELGFIGNDGDYYDPRNSYLDAVLDRRTGIPISLAVVLLEVGRRVGVPLVGVSMPGHFLVRAGQDLDCFIDAFAGGRLLDRDGCRQRFHQLHGPGAPWDPAYLEPVSGRAIVDRQLANLETVARASGETFTLIWVLELRATLPGVEPATLRRLGAALGAGGRHLEAATVLDRLAETSPDQSVAVDAGRAARAMRARMN